MRKALTILVGIVLLSIGIFAQQSSNVEVKKYAVALKDANVRSMPSTQGQILFTVKAGEKLELVEDLGTWLKVKREDGTTGYVWAKLVRIEVEKIVKPAVTEERTVQSPPSTSQGNKTMAPRTYLREKDSFSKFGFSFNFTYALVNPSDFNAVAKGWNSFLSYYQSVWNSVGVSTEIDQPLEEVKNLMGGGVEGKFFLSENIALGLGFSMFTTSKTSSSKLSGTLGGTSHYVSVEQTMKASILAPYFGVHFFIPSDMLTVELFGDVGYFMGSFSIDSSEKTDFSLPVTINFEDLKKSTLGFMGGARVNFNVSPTMGVFLSGKYVLAKFKDIQGTLVNPPSPNTSGTLYYYETNFGGQVMPFLWIPRPTWSSISNVRKAEFDFSGFYLSAGLFFRF